MELFLQSSGIQLKWEQGQMMVVKNGVKSPVNLQNIDRIWVQSEILFDSKTIRNLMKEEVELIFNFNGISDSGTLTPMKMNRKMPLRKKQLYFSISDDAHALAASWISEKQRYQLELLKNLFGQPEIIKYKVWKYWFKLFERKDHANIDELKESTFSKQYFSWVRKILPPWLKFEKRTRQPATDLFSACLNYGYSLIYPYISAAIVHHGLDPFIGINHKERRENPVLSYDLIEAYRPMVEDITIKLFLGKFNVEDSSNFVISADEVKIKGQLKYDLTESIRIRYKSKDFANNLDTVYSKVNDMKKMILNL